jgi:hypothetical protein
MAFLTRQLRRDAVQRFWYDLQDELFEKVDVHQANSPWPALRLPEAIFNK